jgi:protease IV
MTFLLILSQLLSATPVMPLSVTATDDALAMFANPAGLATYRGFNIYYLYKIDKWKITENSSLAGQIGPIGFSWIPGSPFSYGLGLGVKLGDYVSFGTRFFHRYANYWNIGMLIRPAKSISLGATWPDINYQNWRAVIAGIGIRPFGNRLTLFAETELDTMQKIWFGIFGQPVKGIELKGMIKTDLSFSFGIDLSFGKTGIGYSGAKLKTSDKIEHSVYLRFNKDIRPSLVPTQSRFLTLKLSGQIQDIKPGFSLMGPDVQRTTYDILKLLNRAKDDSTIQGIILTLEQPDLSFARAWEIRDALQAIKGQGKKIIVYSPHLSTNTYFIASVADLIISHPLGDVIIPGMYSQVSFVKGTLQKLGIEAEYERVGKYKNAPEILTEDSLSPAYREVVNSVLDDYYGYYLNTTAQARNFTKEEFQKKIDYGFFTADSARNAGLIDTFAYADNLDSVLENKFGKIRKISESNYLGQTYDKSDWVEPANKIDVIYATGSISQGESGTDLLNGGMTIGSNTLSRAIKKARQDKSVKAIILRVDSPGGDGFASDLIWRELEIAKKSKPVIVSMGPVAASGGYYISCNGNKIFALPTTITGSIGVFDLKLVMAGLYDKIGLKNEIIKRGEHADAMSDNRKFTPEEERIMQKWIEDFYGQFVNKVAKGRNKPYAYIDSIAQGRVWTGNQAKTIGLVDTLAGFFSAIDYAKAQAKIKEVKMEFLPKTRSGLFSPMMSWVWNRLLIPHYE